MEYEVKIVVSESDGTEWSYEEFAARIDGPEQINVWDHAKGAPGIDFTPAAVVERIERWKADSEEAENQLEAAQERQPAERVADGAGCVERVHPSERAFYEDAPYA